MCARCSRRRMRCGGGAALPRSTRTSCESRSKRRSWSGWGGGAPLGGSAGWRGAGGGGGGLGGDGLAGGGAVRGTSGREENLTAIEAAGIEPALADPAAPGTVLDLVGDVTAIAWMLGSAQGSGEELSALHGTVLERVLERIVETPVRRFVYEAAGSVDPAL